MESFIFITCLVVACILLVGCLICTVGIFMEIKDILKALNNESQSKTNEDKKQKQ